MVQATAVLLLCHWFSGPIFICVAYSSQASPCCHPWTVQELCAWPVMVWFWPPTYGMFMGWICGFCRVFRRRTRQATHPGRKGSVSDKNWLWIWCYWSLWISVLSPSKTWDLKFITLFENQNFHLKLYIFFPFHCFHPYLICAVNISRGHCLVSSPWR